MKRVFLLLSLLAVGLLLSSGTGCKKKDPLDKPDSLAESVTKMRAALAKANPQVQSNIYNGVDYNIRYEKYTDALMYLDTISNDPSLNAEQKKAVQSTIEALKTRMQTQPSAAKPAP